MIGIPEACFFTGHRVIPKKLYEQIISRLREQILNMINRGVTVFIAGGAIGFDTLAAEQVLALRKDYDSIKLHLYLPCRGQDSDWREQDRDRYQRIKRRADYIFYVTDGEYSDGCMKKRNRAMADSAEYCIAYIVNSRRSGSSQTAAMAIEKGIPVINIADLINKDCR
ncbi:MAG: SLOG family protein [Firmicutes bacterium]|nr:SLOG family protein [Bacillota bacterium]